MAWPSPLADTMLRRTVVDNELKSDDHIKIE